MKRILMPIAAFFVTASITGCQTVDVNVKELASALNTGVEYAETLTEVSADITKKRYNLNSDIIKECAAYAGTRAVADEVAVFKTTDTKEVENKVKEHVDSQIKTYTSYRPDEVKKLDDVVLYTYNDTVIFCVSDDRDTAIQIITDYTTK